jgi:hypothetical protein
MIDLFRGFWWLPFPIAFCLYRAFQNWLSDRSSRETLDLNKTYAASEREPPPELLNRLSKRQNEVACYPQPRTAAGGSGRLQMTPDDQLSAFLGEQPATSRADLFAAVVMQKIERRAFLAQIVTAGGGAAVVGLIAWACAPALNVLIGALAPGLAPAAASLALVAATLLVSSPSVRRRPGFASI